MREELLKKLNAIKRSAEILLENYQTRAFKNNIEKVGLENILGISREAIDEIQKGEKEMKGDDEA